MKNSFSFKQNIYHTRRALKYTLCNIDNVTPEISFNLLIFDHFVTNNTSWFFTGLVDTKIETAFWNKYFIERKLLQH